jgi:hypothetical protein
MGPPDSVQGILNCYHNVLLISHSYTEMGIVMHSCEGEIVCQSINLKIPYFNAPIYLENKVRV